MTYFVSDDCIFNAKVDKPKWYHKWVENRKENHNVNDKHMIGQPVCKFLLEQDPNQNVT